MIDKKILRSELFRHIDGIALIAPITAIFKKDTKLQNLLRKKQEFTISNNNVEVESINGDYLNVTLRLFESQGWLKRFLNYCMLKILIRHIYQIEFFPKYLLENCIN